MTEFERLILERIEKLSESVCRLTSDVGEVKTVSGRMDERLKTVERQTLAQPIVVPESSKSGTAGKAVAVTFSLGGLGAMLWQLVKSFSGSP